MDVPDCGSDLLFLPDHLTPSANTHPCTGSMTPVMVPVGSSLFNT